MPHPLEDRVITPHDLDLDPAILAWDARTAELAQTLPDLAAPPGPARRRAALRLSDQLAEEFTLPVPDGVAIDDVVIETSSGPLRARRFRPLDLVLPAPTQVFLHGGGFHEGTVDELLNDRLCAARAKTAGLQLYSLEYRLAPEHPFPAAVLDAVDAVYAIVRDASYGADPLRVGIGGNSAGATIAASAAIRMRDRWDSPLIHQDLEVVAAALEPIGESAELYRQGFGLDDAAALVGIYVGDSDVPPLASPLAVPGLEGLPPALIMVAEFDPLRDSGLAYARRLENAGVAVTSVIGKGHLHGTPGLTAALNIARQWQTWHSLELARAYDTPLAPSC